ncbi:MAG: hypothetical protein IJI58_04560 [Bacilli bacterium]|nr:hypothetical protein [Bacilli bacterium]
MKNIKISLVLNVIIVLLVVFASFCMFTGFRFMSGSEIVLESNSLEMLKYFTVDSNLFIGIVALIFSYYEFVLLKKEIKKIPRVMYILKLMATTGVALTFLITFTYLAYIIDGGVKVLIMNSNLFFHLIIPVLSIITFMLFEKNKVLSFKDSFYGLMPMFVYAIFYLGNILIHMENGKVEPIYDWYWFVQNGVWTIIIVMPIMTLLTYGISFILWKTNKEK